jgi:hypothetical protein
MRFGREIMAMLEIEVMAFSGFHVRPQITQIFADD